MKKYLSVILAAAMAVSGMAVFTSNGEEASAADLSGEAAGEKQLKIVTTIFPEYDWVREILGDHIEHAEITLLMDNSVDLHSYQPTAEDILKISTCDLFLYVGGESDEWAEDTLTKVGGGDEAAISLLEALGDAAKEEEVVEGMEEEDHDEEAAKAEAEDHGEEAGDDGEGYGEETGDDGEGYGEEAEYDEHVWLSLNNAQVLCNTIAEALSRIDPDNGEDYLNNAEAYNEKLAALDAEYQAAVDNASQKTLLFGDRFPFRYMVDDYGLSYYAAFSGCSAETEASFETIAFLAGKLDELDLNYVLTLEKSDQKIANTIIQASERKDQQILTMDSMQSVSSEDVSSGVTYISVMENNLAVLEEALQ